jgi:glycosyltransferase involved in cell wall biosynthesis
MRILFLSSQLPYPPDSGSRLRQFELLRRVARHADVELRVVSSRYDEDVANAAALAQIVGGVRVFRAEPLRTGSDSSLVGRHRSTAFTAAVGALARGRRFDAVHVDGFSLMRHVPRGCPTPILLAEQRVEHAAWEDRARTCHDPAEHDECLRRARLTREAALAAWRRATLVTAVNERDRAAIAECAPCIAVRVVPDGVDHLLPAARLPTNELETKPTIVFLANFEHQPDARAARRLCREILTRIHRRCPTARLLLVGNSPPGSAHGLPEDAGAVIDAAGVVVCPLPIGGGVTAKLRRKAIVTTSAGFQVLGPHVGRAVEVEDDPEAFADAVAAELERQAERKELELRALELARGLPTWEAAAHELLACYEELVGGRSRGAA